MTSKPRVYLNELKAGYPATVASGLEYVGFFRSLPAGATVFLKPNLTYPEYRPGVMTSMECLRATAETLLRMGYKVIIGEADSGGYNRFPMEAVFESIGLNRLAAELGVQLVNLSLLEPEMLVFRCRGRKLKVPVPRLLIHGIDAFISLPVPKVHLNTRVSLSIKNQWGCIQEPSERLRLHPFFAEVMFEVNRRLPKPHAIIDGRYGLNRSGPMLGDPVPLNWIVVANDLVAADRLGCRLMGIPDRSIRHLDHFRREGWWTAWEDITLSQPWEPFHELDFHLERKWTDLPGLACFNSPFLAWLGYHSPLAGFAHWLLYLVREPLYDYDKEKQKLQGRSQGESPPHPHP